MEITIRTGEATEDNDWKESYEILVDGKSVFSVSDGEPEDNALCRNFGDVYNLPEIFKKIHYSSMNGEILEFIKEKV